MIHDLNDNKRLFISSVLKPINPFYTSNLNHNVLNPIIRIKYRVGLVYKFDQNIRIRMTNQNRSEQIKNSKYNPRNTFMASFMTIIIE